MKILYLDCFSGISGDMLLGALNDLGYPVSHLKETLAGIEIPSIRIEAKDVARQGITARKLTFSFDETDEEHRSYREIRSLLEDAELKETIRAGALQIFEALADAESRVHGVAKDMVHFHEVGGLDTICDVVGAAAARDYLGIGEVYVSPLPFGNGEIACAHGILPNPAPATVELLRGFETVRLPYPLEFVTPTGAAVVRSWVNPERPVGSFRLVGAGYGAGDREVPGRPNVLRALLGEAEPDGIEDRVVLIETDVDDETPEVLAHVAKRLLAAGALDVTSHAVMMKKRRVGTRVSVVAPGHREDALAELLLRETSTLGVRVLPVTRRLLPREVVEVETSLGPVKVKVASFSDGKKKIAPEYEACAVLAERHRLPLREVMAQVKREAEACLLPR